MAAMDVDELGCDTSKFDDTYDESKRVDFLIFLYSIYPSIKGRSNIEPTVVWWQIKHLIKGSPEAIAQQHELSREQYLDKKTFPSKRVRISMRERQEVYTIFMAYQRRLINDHMWDDIDRMNGIHYVVKRISLKRSLTETTSRCSALSISCDKGKERGCWDALGLYNSEQGLIGY